MTITITPVTDIPTPPQKSDPANFPERADTFLASLPDFVTELNAAISELNEMTSGLDQTEPTVAYNSGTTYNFPDICAGTDGFTYRCIDTGVIGVDPVTDDGTNWVVLNAAAKSLPVTDHGSVSGAVAIDARVDVHIMTLTGNTTFSFTNFPSGRHRTLMLRITNGAVSVPAPWPAEVDWPAGEAPELSSARDRIILTTEDGGTIIDAAVAGQEFG